MSQQTKGYYGLAILPVAEGSTRGASRRDWAPRLAVVLGRHFALPSIKVVVKENAYDDSDSNYETANRILVTEE